MPRSKENQLPELLIIIKAKKSADSLRISFVLKIFNCANLSTMGLFYITKLFVILGIYLVGIVLLEMIESSGHAGNAEEEEKEVHVVS